MLDKGAAAMLYKMPELSAAIAGIAGRETHKPKACRWAN
jgi:hypothetical protein